MATRAKTRVRMAYFTTIVATTMLATRSLRNHKVSLALSGWGHQLSCPKLSRSTTRNRSSSHRMRNMIHILKFLTSVWLESLTQIQFRPTASILQTISILRRARSCTWSKTTSSPNRGGTCMVALQTSGPWSLHSRRSCSSSRIWRTSTDKAEVTCKIPRGRTWWNKSLRLTSHTRIWTHNSNSRRRKCPLTIKLCQVSSQSDTSSKSTIIACSQWSLVGGVR